MLAASPPPLRASRVLDVWNSISHKVSRGVRSVILGVRDSTSLLAISANRLERRPPSSTKQRGAASRRPSVIFAGGRLANRFALIANNDVE